MENTISYLEEILEILNNTDYIDPCEHLYDSIKVIKKHIRVNTITLGSLHDFRWGLNHSSVLYFSEDSIEKCIKIIDICIRDFIISDILD